MNCQFFWGIASYETGPLSAGSARQDFLPPASRWGHYRGRNLHFGIREHAMGSDSCPRYLQLSSLVVDRFDSHVSATGLCFKMTSQNYVQYCTIVPSNPQFRTNIHSLAIKLIECILALNSGKLADRSVVRCIQVMNGLALCKLRPFGSTFLVFSDYMTRCVQLPLEWWSESIGGELSNTIQWSWKNACMDSTRQATVFPLCQRTEMINFPKVTKIDEVWLVWLVNHS